MFCDMDLMDLICALRMTWLLFIEHAEQDSNVPTKSMMISFLLPSCSMIVIGIKTQN